MLNEAPRTPVQQSFETLPGMNCFACAPRRLNPSGLSLVFEETPDGARTTFLLPTTFQSYPGFLHGGILSAILDETMAYAGVFKRHVLPFTRTLSLTFRGGVKATDRNECVAVYESDTEKGFTARATIRGPEGRSLVTATAEFVIPSFDMVNRMMPGGGLDAFRDFFR